MVCLSQHRHIMLCIRFSKPLNLASQRFLLSANVPCTGEDGRK